MNKEIIGVVVEFNPLHNGHKRLIDIVKEQNPGAIIIAAMSGQFVQRGELAIYDKWERANSAIENGIDLVVEIPPFFVLNNANIFARKAIDIFNVFGVTKVYFGSENLSVEEIDSIANKMIDQKELFEEIKKQHTSLPRAFNDFIGKDIKPNDTLGICYVYESKVNNYSFEFNRVERYSDEKYTSASKIREDISNKVENNKSLVNSNHSFNIDDYSDVIIGKILTTETDNNVINYLKNCLNANRFTTFTELINNSHNKSFTKAKLRRETIKFVLELEGSDESIILAINEDGKHVLRDIEDYSFGHKKTNEDNYKVERFISIKSSDSLEERLSKKTIIK